MSMKTQSRSPLSPELKSLLLQFFPQGIVAYDMETTGLSPLSNKIIELSAIKITPQGEEYFDQLINPQIPIPANTTEIHGLYDSDVQDSPHIKNVLPQFLDFIKSLPLIAHNAKFDTGFLVYQAHFLKLPIGKSLIYCSYLLTKKCFPELKSYKLGEIAKSFDIQLHNHHRALDDAFACFDILIKNLEHLAKNNHSLPKDSLLFNIQDFNSSSDFKIPSHLEQDGLPEHVNNQTPLLILYKGGSHKGQYRPIVPLSLLPLPQGNFLYARCLLTQYNKSFSLKKITHFKRK